MKVFLGWSGETSHKVALALSDWLPQVLQAVRPFVSSEDIAKGARWATEIAKELSASNYGIICVTRENAESAWINFEAGALSKEIDKALVTPFLFDLRDAEIEGPLKQFQVVANDKPDIFKLVKGINAQQGESSIAGKNLEAAFEMWWPKLKGQLENIQRDEGNRPLPKERATPEMVEELLELARRQQREAEDRRGFADVVEDDRFRQQIHRLDQLSVTVNSLSRSLEALYTALVPQPSQNALRIRVSPPTTTDLETLKQELSALLARSEAKKKEPE
jgi:hypothetical protein